MLRYDFEKDSQIYSIYDNAIYKERDLTEGRYRIIEQVGDEK